MPLFIFTSITAPVGGVLFGGWASDKLGGYNDAKGIYITLKYMLISGSIAVIAAIPASFLTDVRP